MDLKKLEEIKKIAIMAMFSDDTLMENLVLKGGNALDIIYRIGSRASVDLDFSMPEDFNIVFYSDKIESLLVNTFQEHNMHVFDVKVKKRPKTPASSTPDFWGGYKIEFKVIDGELYVKYKDDLELLRRYSLEIASDHKRKFSIDVSKHDYCNHKVEHEIDGLMVYVYSPEMILFEKVRSICQQMPEYKLRLSPSARARDFFDIHSVMQHFKIDLLTDENLEMLKNIFAAKEVPLDLIKLVDQQREFHRPDFVSITDTVKPDIKLKSYDFYFDFVVDMTNKLVQALGIE
jgi:predicted nucleotidyltransferase component of viral defense system